MLERLYISGTGSTKDWIVNDIEINGVSQLEVKNLSGDLFALRGVVTGGRRASSDLNFSGLDVIESESEAAITVTYVGPNPHGQPFFAMILGNPPPQRPTVLPITTKSTLLPTAAVSITAMLDQVLDVCMLEIEDTGTSGGSADWIVNDIRINGISQFHQSGDVPGDLFSNSAIDSFVKFQPGAHIELVVTYIGLNEDGCCFSARLLGTVVRDNITQPPPDVHATLQVTELPRSGRMGTLQTTDLARGVKMGPDEKVVGRCNWRAPYVPPDA
jgi:hypothetical protein